MERLRRWWPWLKLLLVLLVLAGVGTFFVNILTHESWHADDLCRSPLHLLAGTGLYLLGLACCCSFWLVLLDRAGERLPWLTAFRTYYLSRLGIYAPLGKGWALLLRVTLSSSAGVRAGVAALTGAYETLAMMASGALLAAIILLWQMGTGHNLLWHALALLLLAGVPILPPVFLPLVRRLAGRFLSDSTHWPRFGTGTMILGLAMQSCCWALMGASLLAVLQGLDAEHYSWSLVSWLRCTAFVAVSYVAGFAAAFTPGGLGVRELFLQQMLAPELGAGAVVVVLLLRLIWTGADLVIAGLMYWVPARRAVVSCQLPVVCEEPLELPADTPQLTTTR